MHVLGGVTEKVTVLVNRAALDRQGLAPERNQRGLKPRRAIDDDKLRLFQTAGIKIAKEHAPCSFAFSAHILDGKQYLLPVYYPAGACKACCREGQRTPMAAKREIFGNSQVPQRISGFGLPLRR